MMLELMLRLALIVNALQCDAFQITYPQSGDLVNVYNGLTTTWSYNESDSILRPLSIQYVASSHLDESPSYTQQDLNITLRTFTIETTFSLAEFYLLRFIYNDNYYETGHFSITVSEQPRNASVLSSSTSYLVPSTSLPSISTSPTTESSSTETSSQKVTSGSSVSDPIATAIGISNTNGYNNGLSTGAKVGIGIGCSAAGIIGLVGLFVLHRRREKSRTALERPPVSPSVSPTEMDLNGSKAARKVFEADGKNEAANMPELPSHPLPAMELPG